MATSFKSKYFADNSEDQYSFFPESELNQFVYNIKQLDDFSNLPIIDDPLQAQQEKGQDEKTDEKEEGSQLATTKKKTIKKQRKNTKPKRVKDVSHHIPMGRPDNNQTEKEHLKENRSYNNIVYHMSRLLIFLALEKQKVPYSVHSLSLNEKQSRWLSSANEIMSADNFPAFDDQKPIFILHPNTPHFIFSHRNKVDYPQEEVKYIMLAFLQRRTMLTTSIYQYLQKYWRDIIYLVNNPNSQEEIILDQPRDQVLDPVLNDMPSQQQGANRPHYVEKQPVVSQLSIMKQQLQKDPTIVAYEIACYLHACCQKFGLVIRA